MNRRTPLPSGLSCGRDLLTDANWSPEQALAVFELLDDLRARIWSRYCDELQALLQERRSPPEDDCMNGIGGPF